MSPSWEELQEQAVAAGEELGRLKAQAARVEELERENRRLRGELDRAISELNVYRNQVSGPVYETWRITTRRR